MIIEELVLRNFGLYKGRHCVNLEPSAKAPITLIGGLNGGGKTTFLDAIQLSLYGKRGRCSSRGSLSYEEYLRRSINNHVDLTEGAAVEIRIRHQTSGQERTYSIVRSWFVRKGKLIEKLEVAIDGRYDRLLSESWNEFVEQLLPTSLAHLFFFDGEKIVEFADLENSDKSLGRAIHSLLGIDLIDRLNVDLIAFDSKQRINLGTTADKKRIEALRKEIDKIEEVRLDYVEKRAHKQTSEIDHLEKNLQRLLERYRSEGGYLIEEAQALKDLKENLKAKLKGAESRLVDIAAGGAPLLLITDLIHQTEGQSQREFIAKQNLILRDILEKRDGELLEFMRGLGIEKKSMGLVKKHVATDRDQRRADSEIESYLNVSDNCGILLKKVANKQFFEHVAIEIKSIAKQANGLRKKIREIDQKLTMVPDAESLKSLAEDINILKEELEREKINISALDLEVERLGRERDQKKAAWLREVESIFGSELDYEDVDRTLRHSNRVREVLESFRQRLLRNQVGEIERLILDCYKQLLRKRSLIEDLKIDLRDFSLELRNSGGQVLTVERLSAGERQLLAVSTIWGLARVSGRPLPTIIDTPLGRLDAAHRLNLVERYFPNASHQVILLSTDREIDLALFETLRPWIGRTYTLDFDDIAGAASIRPGYFSVAENKPISATATSRSLEVGA